ncbi:UDP-N-acetylmuramate--L-alanine ligase [Fructobacillus pseudoficulneus]|uniref:UDP-N-acetylmuramate--L-alanine ligase n=1 Tax=Fructobacillus pseudoficulneus TaxID=220714 RepID=A0A3F3H252_9LACO|nr:UDP-N-acetylmuramate--L-alanine ligase [Fructobacillus pseudoficulneus]GAP02250.1 UDP-N-acetylmuramate--L-alanine ligase [Fructobacillus pseudoficulneus]SEH36196.1 UDP-N-acetylmuramate--L-alanine ligase [Fructobacillus pseudoficulneus]
MSEKYYFIGIKGTGMGPLAQILHDQGNQVLGSDIDQFTYTQAPLEKAGIKILPFDAKNVLANKDATFIRGNAFEDDQVEVRAALDAGVKMISYPEAVAQQIDQATTIAVAGAHGKTSTTGLLAHVFKNVEKTSYLIGDGTGHGVANSDFFVLEADEYRRHFAPYHPDYAILTNIDFDHPDYYHDLADVQSAFEDFAKGVKKGIVAWGDDPSLQAIKVDVPMYYYGDQDGRDDFLIHDIQKSTTGSTFQVSFQGKELGDFAIPIFGQHNVYNATAVIAIAYLEGIDLALVRQYLLTYPGVKRRFSEKQIQDITIIDDYAHHPTEIQATIDAARQKYPDKEIVAVFQPHTFTRVIAYKDEFAKALSAADTVYLTPIFGSARETQGTVSAQDIADELPACAGILKEEDVSPLLKHHDAVLVFMGAGDIQKYEFAYEKLLGQIQPDLN